MKSGRFGVRLRALVVGAVAVAAFADGAGPVVAAPSRAASDDPDRIPNRYLVILKAGTSLDDLHAVESDAAAHDGKVRAEYTEAVRGFGASMGDAALAAVRAAAAVDFVEPDHTVAVTATRTAAASWGLDRVDQRPATLDGHYDYEATGAGVTVYGIDTGIRATHAEFGGRVAAGWTAIADGNGTSDCNGHGTHTAATIGGATYGVAKGVTLVPVRVLNCAGSGSVMSLLQGIDWVTQQVHAFHVAHPGAGSFVANLSLGQDGSDAIDQAVTSSIAEGITYVVAAGNDSASACAPSPARVPAAITVGATNRDDQRASFSNYGSCVDVWAPGVDIRSAWSGSDSDTKYESGTSMAAPHVAGAAALYLQRFPASTPAQVSDAIRSTATVGVLSNLGSGSPNRMLDAAALGGVANRPPTVGTPVPFLTGGQVTAAGAVPVKVVAAAPVDPDGDGMSSIELEASRDGGATWSLVGHAATATLRVAPSSALRFRVRATDSSGHVSDWVTGPTRALALHDGQTSASYSRQWRSVRSTAALGHSVRRTNRPRASVTISFSGSAIGWIATLARDRGRATVFVDGKRLRVVDLYARSASSRRVVLCVTGLTDGRHRLRIVVAGAGRRGAKGHAVDVDGWASMG